MSADRPSDSGYGSIPSRRPSEDRRRPSEGEFMSPGRRSEESRRPDESFTGGRVLDDNHPPAVLSSGSTRRKQSQTQETPRKSEDREREFVRRPSASASMSATSDSTSTANPSVTQSTTATSGMIIPNKSTIEEEYIEVPYGRDARESGSTTLDDRERINDSSRDIDLVGDSEIDNASDYPGPLSPRSPPGGLSGLSARLKGVEDDDDDDDGVASVPGNRSGDDFFEKYGRSSVNSDRSAGGTSSLASRLAGRASISADQEKMRRDYEFKIATMQTQITNLQRDLGDAAETERKWQEGEARVRQLEDELSTFRRVSLCLICQVCVLISCSARRSKVLACVLYKRNLMKYGKRVNERRNVRRTERGKMRRSY